MTEAIRGALSDNDLVNRARGETFVGRRDELAQLASAAAGVAGSGRGQLVVIAGDAGVGKSRLVREVSDRVSADGWTAAAGGCVDVTAGALTYAALIGILRQLDRHLGRDVMAELAGAGIGDLAPLLPGHSSSQPEAGGGHILERVLDFLARLGEAAPAVVVVEDLHWADSSTRDLVAFLARNIPAARVLLLVTYRTDDLHRRHPLTPLLAELERGDAAWIRLAGLTRPDVADLVAQTSGAGAAAGVSLLLDRTGGNPFYIEELLAAACCWPGCATCPTRSWRCCARRRCWARASPRTSSAPPRACRYRRSRTPCAGPSITTSCAPPRVSCDSGTT